MCGANLDQWCAFAATLDKGKFVQSAGAPKSVGQRVVMRFDYNDNIGRAAQILMDERNGIISTLVAGQSMKTLIPVHKLTTAFARSGTW
jgi:hypothetical protein